MQYLYGSKNLKGLGIHTNIKDVSKAITKNVNYTS